MANRLCYDELVHKATEFRRNPTPAESVAMAQLDKKGKKFYRSQVAFGWYILDIVIPSKLLVVEIDGDTHLFRDKQDAYRDKFCNECGLRVLRLANHEAYKILDRIKDYPSIMDGPAKVFKAIKVAKERRDINEKTKIEHMLRPVLSNKRIKVWPAGTAQMNKRK